MKKLYFLALIIGLCAGASFARAEVFYRNLAQGAEGTDVVELQKILNSNSITQIALQGFGAPGNETTYFGVLTRLAVVKFQELYRNEILDPAGLFMGTGFVGALTRAKLETLVGKVTTTSSQGGSNASQTVVPTPLRPVITSVSTTTVQNGDLITVYGTGFDPLNNAVLLSFESPTSLILPSVDGKTIQFELNSKIGKSFHSQFDKLSKKAKEKVLEQLPDSMPLSIAIEHTGGRSNTVILNYMFK